MCNDSKFYLLNAATLSWEVLGELPQISARAYHTATLVGDGQIAIIGGTSFSHQEREGLLYGSPQIRHCIQTTHIIKFTNNQVNHLQTINFDMDPQHTTYISEHTATYFKEHILVFSGRCQDSAAIDQDLPPGISKHMFMLNIATKQYTVKTVQDSSFKSAGATSFQLAEDCVTIVGGSSKQILLFTNRNVIPDDCAVGPQCKIDNTNEQGQKDSWIQCDKCDKWYHWHCVGLRANPQSYQCPNCRNPRR